jgi:hypothetical protein
MSHYISMFQYSDDTFSVIHNQNLTPEVNDQARVFQKTKLHKPNKSSHDLNIIEVLETRDHKNDPSSKISIVRCEPQI